MPTIVIDQKDFLRGVSSYDDLLDGGYSPLSVGISPFTTPGLIGPGPNPSSISTTGVGSRGIFAWSTWHTALSPGVGRAVSANSSKDGTFLLLSATGGTTLAQTDTGKDYEPIITDMIRYKAKFYVTSNTDITELNSDFSAIDNDFWTSTKSEGALTAGVPHPLVLYGDIMYIADGNVLHQLDGTTSSEDVLILPSDYIITALEVHQNLIYIAASKFSDTTGGTALDSRLFTWNGYSPKFIDEYVLQTRVDAIKVFGGVLLLTTPKYVGYWTGSTINVLRRLTTNVYKHQIAVDNDRLYLAQGTAVLCLANPVLSASKFFSFPIKTEDTIIGLTSYISDVMLLSFNDSGVGSQALWAITNLDASNDTGVTLYSNKIPLNTYAIIEKIIIEGEALTSGASTLLEYITSKGTTVSVGTHSYANYGGISYREYEVFDNEPTYFIQFKPTFTSGAKGIRRIYIKYRPSEFPPNA